MLWLKGKRPKKPRDWDKRVKNAKERVKLWAEGKLPVDDDEKAFENHWGHREVKVAFSCKQHLKCGYCEIWIQGDADGGDIDHFRPKAAVTRLKDDPATHGKETAGHNSRDPKHPRQEQKLFRGYHWLAYAWDNYVFACGTCNRKWKRALFPIRGGHKQAPTEADYLWETPLLLNPYDDAIDPAKHLEFTVTGQVAAYKGSEIGAETIQTLGLRRESLRQARYEKRETAWVYIRALIAELTSNDAFDRRRLRRALQNVLVIGGEKRAHAGMVRAMWIQENPWEWSWEKLRELHNALRTS